MIFVAGGAGFIGSNFVLDCCSLNEESIVNLDLLTHAGNLDNLASLAHHPKYIFEYCDIGNQHLVSALLQKYQPRDVINFAAEFLYKTTDYFASEYERSIAWNDPRLDIKWPINVATILSAKDQQAKILATAEHFA